MISPRPMIRLTALSLVAALLAGTAHGGEIAVEARPFIITTTFEATALPGTGCVPLQIHPASGAAFRIVEIADHRRRVANGDLLVRFDATAMDPRTAARPRPLAPAAASPEVLATQRQRDKEQLAAWATDRAQCVLTAPADGWFYHGLIENGRWTPNLSLAKGACPALDRPFATFVPATATFAWVAFLDEATARALAPGLTGVALLAGREDLEIPVRLASLAATPTPDGAWRADLAATWPANFTPAAGISAQIHLVAYHQPAAIALPNNALAYGPQGWNVEVKLADGKTERRPVKRGRSSADATEILAGLEVGQVVLTP